MHIITKDQSHRNLLPPTPAQIAAARRAVRTIVLMMAAFLMGLALGLALGGWR